MTLKELLDKHNDDGTRDQTPHPQTGLEGALYRWGKAIEGRETRQRERERHTSQNIKNKSLHS